MQCLIGVVGSHRLYGYQCYLRIDIICEVECREKLIVSSQFVRMTDGPGGHSVRQLFATSVVNWYRLNGREFPWRDTKNPFHILIAEVLLRQTQATRVVGTYIQLTTMYPDSESLSKADIADLRQWFQPLGLVRRANRLVECARILVRATMVRYRRPSEVNGASRYWEIQCPRNSLHGLQPSSSDD